MNTRAMLASRAPRSVVLIRIAVLFAACSGSASDNRRAQPEPAARIPYGTAMADVARRFELLGRAATAGRFELAEYQLGEIAEVFEDTLPHAVPPREGHPEVLPATASAFLKTSIPDFQRALAARDRALASAAFERTATACNACHQASGHGFIEVPLVAGRGIPNTDSVSP
jgi:hypothetical protein